MAQGRKGAACQSPVTKTAIFVTSARKPSRRPGRAVERAALTAPWSSGQAEGHITRLKLIKRQMYGRASFDLLRRRILLAA